MKSILVLLRHPISQHIWTTLLTALMTMMKEWSSTVNFKCCAELPVYVKEKADL